MRSTEKLTQPHQRQPRAQHRQLTERLKEALQLVDVRVIVHMVIGSDEVVSFAERGLL